MATDEFIEKIFNDVIRFKPIEHKDNRGFFSEIYRDDIFSQLGLGENYIQDNYYY